MRFQGIESFELLGRSAPQKKAHACRAIDANGVPGKFGLPSRPARCLTHIRPIARECPSHSVT
jgi:hypothetical protein